MFSLYIALILFLIYFPSSLSQMPEALLVPSRFIFWWNLFFGSIVAFFFLSIMIGLSALLFRIPFLGVFIYQFHSNLKESGIMRVLRRYILFWITSQTFIIYGAYLLAYGHMKNTQYTFFVIAIVLIGFIIRRLYRIKSNLKSGKEIYIQYSTGMPVSKEVEINVIPTDPLSIEEKKIT